MKKIIVLIVAIMTIGMFTPAIRSNAQNGFVSIFITPSSEVQQGRTSILQVMGPNIEKVTATFAGRRFDLYRTNVGNWAGLLAVDMDATLGANTLDIYYWTDENQEPQVISQQIVVLPGGFDFQDIPLPYDLEPLLDPELNEYDFQSIERVHMRQTREIFFTTFQQPIPGPSISSFGGFRSYNNGVLTGRHTGIDYRAVIGTAVTAAANGRVVFAQYLPIHGNHIIIDHGWGILTGYSHLSEISVVPGELVYQGQTIGLSGATGRVQGPHLHFEVAVNGSWVDGSQFLTLEIPLPAIN
ncbi:MAG: hypothetical protein CUN55_08365 [Phototrophicales bacterium]|nr:MAG: hypothetical protein CUN55_08365 [Phototrophicales bacterium]